MKIIFITMQNYIHNSTYLTGIQRQ